MGSFVFNSAEAAEINLLAIADNFDDERFIGESAFIRDGLGAQVHWVQGILGCDLLGPLNCRVRRRVH